MFKTCAAAGPLLFHTSVLSLEDKKAESVLVADLTFDESQLLVSCLKCHNLATKQTLSRRVSCFYFI